MLIEHALKKSDGSVLETISKRRSLPFRVSLLIRGLTIDWAVQMAVRRFSN